MSRFRKPATTSTRVPLAKRWVDAVMAATPAAVAPDLLSGNQVLVEALRRGDRVAVGALYDHFQPIVERTLVRIVGSEPELPDLVHETFLSAMRSLGSVRDPQALPVWMMRVAVRTAADWLRRHGRRRWLTLLNPPAEEASTLTEMDVDGAEAVRETYRILAELPVDERIAFSLRFIDGRELTEVATSCGCSLATAKRRLSRAEIMFVKLARQSAVLRDWVDEGERWGRA